VRPFEQYLNENIESPTSSEFRNWFGDSVVTESLKSGGSPLVVYHGTTHSFEAFEAKNQNIENFLGRAFYFTSNEDDAAENYGSSGPDLTIRINTYAEGIASSFDELDDNDGEGVSIEDVSNFSGVSLAELKKLFKEPFLSPDDLYALSLHIANKEISGGEERVLEVYLRIENPFWYDDHNFTFEGGIDEGILADYLDDAESSVAEDESLNWEEDDKEEWADEIREKQEELYYYDNEPVMSGDGWDFIKKVIEHADEYDNEGRDEDILMAFREEFGYEEDLGEIPSNQLIPWVKEKAIPYLYDYSGDDGQLASTEVIKESIRDIGYDGIIMHPDRHFPSMNHMSNTYHFIVFDPSQVKSIHNKGSWSRESTNLNESIGSRNQSVVHVNEDEWELMEEGENIFKEVGI
jgi:hypothetical protein